MPIELAFWPEEIIALNAELASGLHPELEASLAKHHGSGEEDFLGRFGTIAEYCSIHLDGMFTSDNMVEVAKIMLARLPGLRKRPDDGKIEVIRAL